MICSGTEISVQETSDCLVHEKMDSLYLFSGSLNWTLGELFKRKGALQSQMQYSWGELQGLKKTSFIFLQVEQEASYSMREEIFLYFIVMTVNDYC